MSAPAYQQLSREQIGLLLAPGNEDLESAWMRLTGALHGMMKMLSVTYPRPLYYEEADARRALVEQPERLRESPFYEAAVGNAEAAGEIERLCQEQGRTEKVNALVDAFIEDLLDEYDALRLYPEVPPPRAVQEPNPWTARFVAGGR
jgi:hypothetical protein